MQLRGPAADVGRLHLDEGDRQAVGEGLQPPQRGFVDGERTLGEAPLDPQVDEVARDLVVERRGRTGRGHGPVPAVGQAAATSRLKPAPASSPMRTRKSVPMSAV